MGTFDNFNSYKGYSDVKGGDTGGYDRYNKRQAPLDAEANFKLDAIEPMSTPFTGQLLDSGRCILQGGPTMELKPILQQAQMNSLQELLDQHPELKLEQVRSLLRRVSDLVEAYAKLPEEGRRLVRSALAVEDFQLGEHAAADIATEADARKVEARLRKRERDRARRAEKKGGTLAERKLWPSIGRLQKLQEREVIQVGDYAEHSDALSPLPIYAGDEAVGQTAGKSKIGDSACLGFWRHVDKF